MKKLYLVRHAKSSWSNPELRDYDRPLNKRGLRDAPFMGKLIKEKGIMPELLIASPARRALITAEYFADALGFQKKDIIRDEDMYEAGLRDILKVISEISNEIGSAMLFGHNPGLTDVCNFIAGRHIDNIPTAAVVSLMLKISQWNDIEENTCELEFFEFPKKYFI